jgi:hypothetical protein
MIALRLAALLAALLIGTTPRLTGAWVKPTTGEILELSKAGLVKIVVTGRSKSDEILSDYGSGFAITSDGFVVSAAHLFSHDWQDVSVFGRIAYLNNDDVLHRDALTELKVVYKDVGTDIALLRFLAKPEGLRALPLRTSVPTVAEPLFVLGFPGGQNNSTNYQVAFQSLVSEHRFQFQGVANFGNSGGPILDENGYVVGIDLAIQAEINSVPITNTYLAGLTRDFPTPTGFKPSTIRPFFQNPGALSDGPFSPVWNDESIKRSFADFTKAKQQKACNMSMPSDWSLVKDPKRGFIVLPPSQTDLSNASFRLEFSVRERENYVTQQEQREASGRFGPTPFHFIPLGNQTLILSDIDMGTNAGRVRTPLVFQLLADNRPLLFQYFPRKFGPLDFHPGNADSAILFCEQNGTVPPVLFVALCESMARQALSGYYGHDNPCLPGSSH